VEDIFDWWKIFVTGGEYFLLVKDILK